MRNFSNLFWPFIVFLLLSTFFFWPVFIRGQIPFSGDLLVGEYEPYKSGSYFGWSPGGVPNKAQGPDVIREAYPWKSFAISELKEGQLPLWNPYNFSGNPQLANFQTAVFYPLNMLFLVFPFSIAWTIFIFIQPAMAGFFMYLLAKELGLGKLAAIFSGTVFAFSSFFTVWIEYGNLGHSFLWLPLVLYFTEKLIKSFDWKNAIFLILTLTLSILGGFIQITIYIFGVVLVYFLYRFFSTEKKNITHLLSFATALTIPFIIAAFQLLPTIEIFQFSARGAYHGEDLPRVLDPIYYTITTFIPDFFGHPATRNYWIDGTYIERVSYIGVIPLLLVLISFFSRKKNYFWFFVALAGVAYLLSLNIFPTTWFFSLEPPIISTAVPTRILSLFCFAGAILAGIGLNAWLTDKGAKSSKRAVTIFTALYVFFWLFVLLSPEFFPKAEWIGNLGISKRNLFLPTSLAVLGGGLILMGEVIKKRKIVSLVLLVLTLFDLFYFFQKITPFSPKEFIYPKTPVFSFLKDNAGINRFWGYGIASIDTNFATYEKIFSTDGSDALHIKRYGELIAASKGGKIPDPVPRRDANIWSGYGQDDLRNNFFRQRILDLLGVKYVLNKNENLREEWAPDYKTFPKESYKLVWQEGSWQAYENLKVLPRFFLSSDYVVVKNDTEIIQKIFDKNFNLKTIILEEEVSIKLASSVNGKAKLKSYTPNKITFSVDTDQPQLLFLSDSNYPGWQAFVDTNETKIYRADYAFRSVVVPSGKHEVVFSYRPKFWIWKQ